MPTILTEQQLRVFINEVFIKAGVSAEQARAVTDNLVWSELVGRQNFGVIRIPIHLERLKQGVLNPICNPVFSELSVSAAQLDADNGFGYYAGELAMERAIRLARHSGVGAVTVRNSNFYGTGAYFVQQAAHDGMIGLALSNSYPKVAAHGGRHAVLGTNPFAFSAPRADGKSLLVDFATSSLAGSTVREHLEKGELLPEGMAVGKDGTPARDPAKIHEASLLPFGGAKGFGLSLMVEFLAGILSGAGFSHGVKSTYTNFQENSDSGHFFLAIDIAKWMEPADFFARFEALEQMIKASDPDGKVILPGEARWQNLQTNNQIGIRLNNQRVADLKSISAEYDVEWPV